MDWNDLLKQVAAGEPCSVDKGTAVSGAMLPELLQAARTAGNRPTEKRPAREFARDDIRDFTSARDTFQTCGRAVRSIVVW